MTIPQKIQITRMEDYHTDLIGRCNDGTQFFIYESFAFTVQYSDIPDDKDWKDFREEYVVKYLFDSEGDFLKHEHWFGGTTSSCNQNEMSKIKKKMLLELGEYNLCDIEVKLFQVEINGHVFGLIANEENETVDLMPSHSISFMEPWDGEYYT